MFTSAKIVTADADPDNYHAQDAKPGERAFVMSSGQLRDFASCPARWTAGYRSGETQGEKVRKLILAHALAPQRFASKWAVRPDSYQARVLKCPECGSESDAKVCRKCGLTRISQVVEKPWAGAADYCRKWTEQAEKRGQTIVRAEMDGSARTAVARLENDKPIQALREQADRLVWIAGEWKDAHTGIVIPVRTLIAYLPRPGSAYDNAIATLRTTRDASHNAFRRQAYYGLYHLHAAWALDLLAAATGNPRQLAYIIIAETVEPFEPARRSLSPTFLQLGRRTYETMLAQYAACLDTNTWPSYDLSEVGPAAWTTLETEPWMHQGDDTSAGFQPTIAPHPAVPDAYEVPDAP